MYKNILQVTVSSNSEKPCKLPYHTIYQHTPRRSCGVGVAAKQTRHGNALLWRNSHWHASYHFFICPCGTERQRGSLQNSVNPNQYCFAKFYFQAVIHFIFLSHSCATTFNSHLFVSLSIRSISRATNLFYYLSKNLSMSQEHFND